MTWVGAMLCLALNRFEVVLMAYCYLCYDKVPRFLASRRWVKYNSLNEATAWFCPHAPGLVILRSSCGSLIKKLEVSLLATPPSGSDQISASLSGWCGGPYSSMSVNVPARAAIRQMSFRFGRLSEGYGRT